MRCRSCACSNCIWPHSEIFWWLESSLVPLLADDPDLAGIFTFERKRWAAPRNWPETFEPASARMRGATIRSGPLICRDWRAAGLFTWLANAELSIGLDNAREGAREGARLYYDVIAPRAAAGTHAVDRYLAVLPQAGRAGAWTIPMAAGTSAIGRAGAGEMADLMARVGWRCCPGARWNNKRWPVENFVELVRRMSRLSPDLKFAILGGKADSELGSVIAGANPGALP